MMRAVLIATSLAMAMPCFAQGVRVISGDIEHLYPAASSSTMQICKRETSALGSTCRLKDSSRLRGGKSRWRWSVSNFRRQRSPMRPIRILRCGTQTAAGGTAAGSSDPPEAGRG
jgi:hypothetical protein